MDTEMKGPELLRVWREGLELTRMSAASIMGVSPASYGDWEAGRKTPRTALAVRIARITSGLVPIGTWCPNEAEMKATG